MMVPLVRLGAFTQMFTAPVVGVQVSNSQFSSMVPAASEVKIKSQGTEVALLPTVCVQVLEILPPLAVVAKSAIGARDQSREIGLRARHLVGGNGESGLIAIAVGPRRGTNSRFRFRSGPPTGGWLRRYR